MNNLGEYRDEALKLWATKEESIPEQLLHASLGLFGELAELNQAMYSGNVADMIDELGDVLYYSTIIGDIEDPLTPIFVLNSYFEDPAEVGWGVHTLKPLFIPKLMEGLFQVYGRELQFIKKTYFRKEYKGDKFSYSEVIDQLKGLAGGFGTDLRTVASFNLKKLQARYDT